MENGEVEITEEDFKDPVAFQWAYLKQIPHKKQEEVLLSSNKNKIIVCGRRSGKTKMVSGEWIRGAVLKLYPKQFAVAPTYNQVMIIYNTILELMYQGGVYDDIENATKSPRPKIVFKNGCSIDFGSADNPDSLRGPGWDRVWKDESAFIKRGADAALKPTTYDKGAPVWETTTPWGKGDVWGKWLRGLNPKNDDDKSYGCFHYNYKDNPYLNEDGVKEIERDILEYGEDSMYVQCEIYGNFMEDRDVYFSRELIESCIEEYNIPEEPNRKWSYGLGNDVAGEGEDESVFISMLSQDVKRVVSIDNYEKNKPREIVGKNMELYNKYKYVKMCLDKTGLGEGPEDWIKEELEKIGVFGGIVEGIRFTIQTKMDMYSNLKKLMNQGKIKFPNHKKLVFQLMDLRYEVISNGNLKLHHSDRGHDDYPDALALACWACRNEEIYKPTLA